MSNGFAFIDTETTGTHAGARVIELAVVTFSPQGRRTGSYSTLLRGDGTVGGPMAQRVHGIREADIRDAPTFGEIWSDFSKRVDGHVLVAHNATFDRTRINHELSLVRKRPLPDFPCTMRLAYDLGYARRRSGDVPGVSGRLGELVKRLGLDVSPTHRALADAEAAAALFWYFRRKHRADVDVALRRFTPARAL